MVTLMMGDCGIKVRKLQTLLNTKLFPSPCLRKDCIFGPKTYGAVIRFQKNKGLRADGIVGKKTWFALGYKAKLRPKFLTSSGNLSQTNSVLAEMKPRPTLVASSVKNVGTRVAHTEIKPMTKQTPISKNNPKTLVAREESKPAPIHATASGDHPWLDIAWDEKGVLEVSLPGQDNPRIIEYHATTTLKAKKDEVPWCSSFVNWVMTKAGYKGTNCALAKNWLNWGTALTDPREGAITVIKKKKAGSDRATGSATGYHVAFFLSSRPGYIKLLGGNQHDQVRVSTYPLKQYEIKGYRWPSKKR